MFAALPGGRTSAPPVMGWGNGLNSMTVLAREAPVLSFAMRAAAPASSGIEGEAAGLEPAIFGGAGGKAASLRPASGRSGRATWIRTKDLRFPKPELCQAELLPDVVAGWGVEPHHADYETAEAPGFRPATDQWFGAGDTT